MSYQCPSLNSHFLMNPKGLVHIRIASKESCIGTPFSFDNKSSVITKLQFKTACVNSRTFLNNFLSFSQYTYNKQTQPE